MPNWKFCFDCKAWRKKSNQTEIEWIHFTISRFIFHAKWISNKWWIFELAIFSIHFRKSLNHIVLFLFVNKSWTLKMNWTLKGIPVWPLLYFIWNFYLPFLLIVKLIFHTAMNVQVWWKSMPWKNFFFIMEFIWFENSKSLYKC